MRSLFGLLAPIMKIKDNWTKPVRRHVHIFCDADTKLLGIESPKLKFSKNFGFLNENSLITYFYVKMLNLQKKQTHDLGLF